MIEVNTHKRLSYVHYRGGIEVFNPQTPCMYCLMFICREESMYNCSISILYMYL